MILATWVEDVPVVVMVNVTLVPRAAMVTLAGTWTFGSSLEILYVIEFKASEP